LYSFDRGSAWAGPSYAWNRRRQAPPCEVKRWGVRCALGVPRRAPFRGVPRGARLRGAGESGQLLVVSRFLPFARFRRSRIHLDFQGSGERGRLCSRCSAWRRGRRLGLGRFSVRSHGTQGWGEGSGQPRHKHKHGACLFSRKRAVSSACCALLRALIPPPLSGRESSRPRSWSAVGGVRVSGSINQNPFNENHKEEFGLYM